MRILKIFIITVSLFGAVFTNVNAAQKYEYVCDNDLCYNTKLDFIGTNYYMYPVTETNVSNFKNTIDLKLQDYIDYYSNPDIKFTIVDFCEGDCENDSDLYDRDFTLQELLSYGSGFHIGESTWSPFAGPDIVESFDDGYDYLFTYFTKTIDELNDNGGYPSQTVEDNLSDLVGNILYYSGTTNNFHLRNICSNSSCNESLEKDFSYLDTDSYTYVSGDIKQSDTFAGDTFKVSEDYKIAESSNIDTVATLIKAGSSIIFDFGFEDYLDFTEDYTKYRYRIYYNNDGEGIPDVDTPFLEEEILVNNDTLEVTSTGIGDQVNEIIKIDLLDEDTSHISVRINEGITLSKVGSKNFYLQADNLTSGDTFDISLVNNPPLDVLVNDNITSGTGQITTPFSPELNSSDSGFGVEQPFAVSFNLYDQFGNEHFDEIGGYYINISPGSSDKIELTTDPDPDTAIRTTSLNGVKTDSDHKVNFYFRITEPGYHVLNGFDFKVKSQIDSSYYKDPVEYNYLNGVIPSNLYDGETKMNIYIKVPVYDELPISCGNPVNIVYVCTSDNLSGCYPTGEICDDSGCRDYDNSGVTYSSQSDNNQEIKLSVRDYAYNWTSYSGTLNHVDTTAPVVSLFKGSNELSNTDYSYIVSSDQLTLKFYEWTTSSCNAETKYTIKVNDNYLTGGTLLGSNTEIILNDLFKIKGDYKLDYYVEDKYGNSTNGTINFTLYADEVDPINSNTSISLENSGEKGTKYANNSDIYNYVLKLEDKFGNVISDKDILGINFKCPDETGCIELKTEGDYGDDAIIEYNTTGKTGINGEKIFYIKGLSPGDFTEYVNIKMYKWDNDNIDNTSNIYTYSIGSSLNKNSFKKPIKGNLRTSDNSIPTLGVEKKYIIDLEKIDNNNLIIDSSSRGKLDLTKYNIVDTVDGHYWNKFDLINNLFDGDNINTELSFTGMIDADDNVLEGINLSSDNLKIEYKLGGKNIKYSLDDFSLNTSCNRETLGLKVIGNLQGEGKYNITGQKDNFSDLTKSRLRGEIRKKAYSLIRNRISSDRNINNIIFIEGNKSYSEIKNNLEDNDTIIIKNGNFIIDENINKNVGIIVLKDNYDMNSDYNKEGNIYINNEVTYIKAIIYADGALRSADEDGIAYNDSSLGNKLELFGSIFTRNTIGGAVKGGTSFTLPGGQEINSFDIAQIYDLNYIRKVEISCDGSEGDGYSFIIKFNPKNQINPPKGFSK